MKGAYTIMNPNRKPKMRQFHSKHTNPYNNKTVISRLEIVEFNCRSEFLLLFGGQISRVVNVNSRKIVSNVFEIYL